MTSTSQHSLAILRDTSHFAWYIVPLFVIVVYAYFHEAERGHWSRVLGALAFVGMDFFNEIWNALVLRFSGYAPVWGIAHDSAWLILIGLNVEIVLNFAVLGLAATMLLPQDKRLKIFGVDNRLIFAIANSVLCVLVELALNHFGMLTWEWPWWNATHPWLIFLVGYMPFFVVCYWVYDMENRRAQIATVGTILGIDALLMAILIPLGWI